MYRVALAVGVALLIGLQAMFVVFVLESNLQPVVDENTDGMLQRTSLAVEKSQRLDEFALQEKARHVSFQPGLRQALTTDFDADPDVTLEETVRWRLLVEQHEFQEREEAHEEVSNLELDLLNRRPAAQDLLMVVNVQGELVAAAAGAGDRSGEPLGDQYPLIHTAMDQQATKVKMWNWSWDDDENHQLHLVAVSPIPHPHQPQRIVGAVVLGTEIDHGVAEHKQELLATSFAPDVTFFSGEQIHGSTLDRDRRDQLGDSLFEEHRILEEGHPELGIERTAIIDGDDHRTLVRFFPGEFDTEHPTGLVMSTNHTESLAALQLTSNRVLAIGAAAAVAGLMFVLLMFHLFLKPFGRLEEGVQEILSGQKDYEFDTEASHEPARNMAQHLNLLSAHLQGKPMPDEETTLNRSWNSSGWEVLRDPDEPPVEEGSAEVAGVPKDELSDGPESSDHDDTHDESPDGDEHDDTSDESTLETAEATDDEPAGEPT